MQPGTSEHTEILKQLLPFLDNYMKEDLWARHIQELKFIRMFPVTTPPLGAAGQAIRLCASSDRFWISDSSTLHQSFSGKLPLLDYISPGKNDPGGQASGFSNIFKFLGMENKILSNAVRCEYEWDASGLYLDAKLTNQIRDKISYIHGYEASLATSGGLIFQAY
jgi:hypothetical protein